MADFETGNVPVHFPTVEDQPYVPRNGWTIGESSAWTSRFHHNDLPVVPAADEFTVLVASAKRLLAELAELAVRTQECAHVDTSSRKSTEIDVENLTDRPPHS